MFKKPVLGITDFPEALPKKLYVTKYQIYRLLKMLRSFDIKYLIFGIAFSSMLLENH